MTKRIEYANDEEIDQAIYNCYPTTSDRIGAIFYMKRHGVFPFDPKLN